MKTYTLKRKNTQETAFSGVFDNPSHCLESAIGCGVSLHDCDLVGLMLMHANLDGGCFAGANLDGCDLTGANLSECDFSGATFRGADLSLAAFCESRLVDADFSDASFAGTLLAGATISGCRFTCASALGLPFGDAALPGRNWFGPLAFTAAPVVVTGLPKHIVFLDDAVLIGGIAYPRADLPNPFENLFPRPAQTSAQTVDEA